MRVSIVRRLRAALFAAAVACGAVVPAQAAVYVGVWDPPYGPAFPNLGWRGEIVIDAPTSCGTSDNFTGIAPCAPGAAFVSSAFVELYLLDTSPTFPTVNTLVFDPLSMNVTQLAFTGGDLFGAVTSRSNWVFDAVNDAYFALQFAYEGMAVAPGISSLPGGDTYSGPLLWYKDQVCVDNYRRKHGGYDEGEDVECAKWRTVYGTNDLVSADTRPALTFNRVPEPGSLALVLAGGLAALRLRRRTA